MGAKQGITQRLYRNKNHTVQAMYSNMQCQCIYFYVSEQQHLNRTTKWTDAH